LPLASILNYQLENIANATTVALGPTGTGQFGITVQADAKGTDFIADVNGYYVPRPFTLESGQTLRGTFLAGTQASAAGVAFGTNITFQFPLASAPSVPFANFIAAGASATTNCPDSPTNPTALPGNLCVYEGGSQNSSFIEFLRASVPATGLADPVGVALSFSTTAAGTAASVGTWAVTAP
jgi:hypothetical protein